MIEPRHESVLMKEVLEALDIKPSDVVVDATIGGAGHFEQMLSVLDEDGVIVAIDADQDAVARGREAYARDRRTRRPVAHIVNENFRNLAKILERFSISEINKILFDLGWSGYQIASTRGFSFSEEIDQPLLMNYSDSGETAADIVNNLSEQALADLIFSFGEEKFARSIAHEIVRERSKNRLLTTKQLVNAILAGTPEWYHHRKIHPATKTFQALRIVVNDELNALQEGLNTAISALSKNGRLAVISFHSIEDRTVKTILNEAVASGLGTLISKKPITATRDEVLANPRSRSAKLRVFYA